MARRVTLAEIERMEEDFLKPDVIAACIGCSPQSIRGQADENTEPMGFPISRIGHAYWIPKEGFLNWARYNKKEGR